MTNNKLMAIIGGIVLASVIAISTTIFSSSQGSADGPRLVGQMQNFVLSNKLVPRPEISWLDGNGKNVTLADFDGKVVLLNYWASWCLPCQRELPGIDRIQAKMAGANFSVVALNIDKGGKKVAEKYTRRLKIKNLDINVDPEHQTVSKLGVRAMPTTYLFSRKGILIGRLEGGTEWDTSEGRALIQYFIDHPNYSDNLKSDSGA